MGIKSKSLALVLVALFLVSLVVVPPATVKAQSKTITVPDDYPTIRDALINAVDGTTVYVKKGTYTENSLVINKTLTLIGENATTTIIHNPWIPPYWDAGSSDFPPPKAIAIQISAKNVKISGFTITGNAIPLSILADGTQIVDNNMNSIDISSNNNTISQNRIKTYVECHGSFNNFISNPLIGGGSDGFFIDGSFNVVYDNNLSGCSITITGNSNTIAKNSGYFSLLLSVSSNNIVYGNSISGDLSLRGFNNVCYANEISTISISTGGSHYADNNTFYKNNILGHNSFLGKFPELWVQSKEPGLLVWDNGKVGNYWKSYLGVDANGDGIGDIPYNVTAGYHYFDGGFREEAIIDCGHDNFPLIQPFDIASVPVQLPDWVILDFQSEQSILVISPQNRTYNFTNVTLNFTVPEYSLKVLYSLDGKENVTITGNTTITGLSNGLHNITVYAQDTFGNIGSSQTISFNVAKPEPESFPLVSVLVASVVSVVVVVAAGLLLFSRHRKTINLSK
jgi:nitrous oxidase accessory protein NosD